MNCLKCKFLSYSFWFFSTNLLFIFILDSKQWVNDNLCTLRVNAILLLFNILQIKRKIPLVHDPLAYHAYIWMFWMAQLFLQNNKYCSQKKTACHYIDDWNCHTIKYFFKSQMSMVTAIKNNHKSGVEFKILTRL